MRVILAGYNIDLDGLREEKYILTPETFSAAYARISRSPKSIPQLRAIARHEIAQVREQNRRIIYEMGHHSIAEHCVFNFDIIGVSRLAVEYLESHRLMSYTEASQRYIKWATNYVTPKEIKKTSLEPIFHNTIKEQLKAYTILTEQLRSYETKLTKPIEDARYVTCLAMQTQLGMTTNARNLELAIRRFTSSNIDEVNTIGRKLYNLTVKVAPSVILFFERTDFDSKTYSELEELLTAEETREIVGQGFSLASNNANLQVCPTFSEVTLVDYSKDGDDKLIALLICKTGNSSFNAAVKKVKKLSSKQKLDIIKTAFKYAKLYDSVLREFEHSYLTFELILSASCFAQLKRHRIATITAQEYNPDLGVTVPHTIRESKQTDLFYRIIETTEKTYDRISRELPQIAPYILTQAHRRRVLLTVNVRELYHMVRLRMDATAQWDIRELTEQMAEQAKRVMPLSLLFSCAKDKYDLVYRQYFNK